MEMRFKTRISVIDDKNLKSLFVDSINSNDDLLWLVNDLAIAIKYNRNRNIKIYFEKIKNKYTGGILKDAFLDYINGKCTALNIFFARVKDPVEILLLNNNVKSVSDSPKKYYIYNVSNSIEYSIVIY